MSVRLLSLGLFLLSFCSALPAQKQRQWQDDITHQIFPPQQARYCDIFQQKQDDMKAHTAATRDAFKAQSVSPIDNEKYGRELDTLLGPEHIIDKWVGTVSAAPSGRGVASVTFTFNCTSPKEAEGENIHSVSTNKFQTGSGANEIQSPPLPFTNVIVAKLIDTPGHTSMAQVSGQIVYPHGGKLPLDLRNEEEQAPLPGQQWIYFRFSRVALPSSAPR